VFWAQFEPLSSHINLDGGIVMGITWQKLHVNWQFRRMKSIKSGSLYESYADWIKNAFYLQKEIIVSQF
jgi:hypothetical protein